MARSQNDNRRDSAIQAEIIRASAERLEIRGDFVTALIFRDNAWKIESGREWLDDIKLKEQQ